MERETSEPVISSREKPDVASVGSCADDGNALSVGRQRGIIVPPDFADFALFASFGIDPHQTRNTFGLWKESESAVLGSADDAECFRIHERNVAERQRGGVALQLERLRVEALRHQHRAAGKDKAVGRNEDSVRNLGEQPLTQLAVKRAGEQVRVDDVEELVVRDEPGPAMSQFFRAKRRDALASSSA